jgi:iron complex transport system ATP-binding protein
MPGNAPALLACEQLRVEVPGRRLVDKLELAVHSSEFLAVLGRNGTGKSLTLQTLAGLRPAASGAVLLQGEDIFQARRDRTARHLALLPQVIDDIFPSTVFDTALIGRHPHVGSLQWESPEDRSIAADSLREMRLDALADRDVMTLSGGERRRLAIAQILTQRPQVFLLDEPTNHLDLQHQLDALRIFRDRAANGAAVIASLHDVNLAARVADRCLLLFGDGRWLLGERRDILTETTLSELYATRIESVRWRSENVFVAASDHATP